ncbi:uncharacterized protein OCT59_004894 [Rhizophagus irregularis]|uniref:uncharacterized protein n=1 Tax=Rhizophagus irregularis TaxID=588596 RepID=UPI003316655C|nr:hypothetical protein OCT59_004894 [Rhizophagus irregularis]
MDQFISENKLKWVPYNKFEEVEYLDKGGFGTIYKATYKKYKVILKYFDYLNNSDESLNEFLNEWKIINSNGIIRVYGFTKDPDTSNYMLIMQYANRVINEELKSNIMEFTNAPIKHNNQIVESHPQVCYTSHLLDFTSEELNESLEGFQGLKFLELKQKDDDAEQELPKLEVIAETNYQSSIQMELAKLQQRNSQFKQENQALTDNLTEQTKQISKLNHEKINLQNQLSQIEANIRELKLQQDKSQSNYKKIEEENLKLENELVDSQQRNFKFEQNNQNLRFNLAVQIKEFAEKEDILQTQIINLQNEKQSLAGNLAEQLKQNKLTKKQVQIQIIQLEQEKVDLQGRLTQTEVEIQELKSHKENLIEQKEQLANRLNQFQDNYEQIEQESNRLQNVVRDLSQVTKLKAKLENEISQLEHKLINEEQIKMQLTQALQIKEDKINELEQRLINLDQERIKKLIDKEKELSEVKGELVNKLSGGDTKEIPKEKEAKQKELDELQQELSRTSASYDANRKKKVLNQVNKFLKAKGGFLTLREEAIKKLQNCLESFINKEGNTIGSTRDLKTSNLADKYTKEFQYILVKYNDGLLELNKNYYSLENIVQENKELEVSLMIENILKLYSFNLDKYKIFKFATNSQEGTRIQLNSNMMAEDINSLRKNLNELKLELEQEKKELRNLAAD